MAVADALPVRDEDDGLQAAISAPATTAGVPAGPGPRQSADAAPCRRAPAGLPYGWAGPPAWPAMVDGSPHRWTYS